MRALLTDALRARVGETVSYVAPEPIGLAAGRYFALALGDPNPLYRERRGGLGPIVPPTWLLETNTYVDAPMDADGFGGHSWDLDVPDSRLVRGGHHYRWERDVLPDDLVTATWTLAGMAERTTRTGAPMLVVTSTCRYLDAAGLLIAEQTEDLIFVGLE